MQEFGHNYSWSNLEDGRSISITSLSVVGDKKCPNQNNSKEQQQQHQSQSQAPPMPTKEGSTSQEVVPIYVNIEELRKASELKQKTETVRPVVVCGLTIKGRLISNSVNVNVNASGIDANSQMIIEDLNAINFTDSSTCLCLVVYDFQYTKDVEHEVDAPNKKATITANNKPVNNIITVYDVDYNLMDASNSSEAMTFINDMNYQALKLLKQTESNNYQNLIPGESDDIFLPPPPPPPAMMTTTTTTTAATQSISGTRVLVVDEPEEPDASTTSPPNYQFMNGQLNSPTEASNTNINIIEKSISDHITDLKSSKNKRLNYSHAVQCVALPAQYKNNKDLEIFEIVPTKDGSHVLVVLRAVGGGGHVNSVLLVYSLCFGASVVRLHDQPMLVRELPDGQCPKEVSVIPSADTIATTTTTAAATITATNATSCCDGSSDGASANKMPSSSLDGSAVIVCTDGVVRIFELVTLKPTCVAKLESEKLVSAAYCNSKYNYTISIHLI